MRILHFIPSILGDEAYMEQYKLKLLKTMATEEEVHLLAPTKLSDKEGITTYKYSIVKTLIRGRGRSFSSRLKRINPDIVHIHACWSGMAYSFMRECIKEKIPVVITVDKRLEPWHILRRYYIEKLPKLFLYQRFMLRKANALHATTSQEEKTLENFRKGKSSLDASSLRIVTINRFDITSEFEAGDMSKELITLYRKVLDSHPFMGMTEEERHLEDALLSQGMTEKDFRKALTKEEKDILQGAGSDSWRRIFLHSKDEGIYDYVLAGAGASGLEYSLKLGIDSIERFPSMKIDGKTKKKNSKVTKILSSKQIKDKERELSLLFLGIFEKLKKGKLHRSDFVTIYRKLRLEDYDEDVLIYIMSKLKLSKKVSRLFYVLNERYGLETGFMFLEPLDDKGTRKLRKKLYQLDVQ